MYRSALAANYSAGRTGNEWQSRMFQKTLSKRACKPLISFGWMAASRALRNQAISERRGASPGRLASLIKVR